MDILLGSINEQKATLGEAALALCTAIRVSIDLPIMGPCYNSNEKDELYANCADFLIAKRIFKTNTCPNPQSNLTRASLFNMLGRTVAAYKGYPFYGASFDVSPLRFEIPTPYGVTGAYFKVIHSLSCGEIHEWTSDMDVGDSRFGSKQVSSMDVASLLEKTFLNGDMKCFKTLVEKFEALPRPSMTVEDFKTRLLLNNPRLELAVADLEIQESAQAEIVDEIRQQYEEEIADLNRAHQEEIAPMQRDRDADGFADYRDNCPTDRNPQQADDDRDERGDACDPDDDGDGVLDTNDNCPGTRTANTTNTDGDNLGDMCDPDDDGDSIPDASDNCPLTANADQANTDGGASGNACDADNDGDGILDGVDNCPLISNANQRNTDGGAKGDACDGDDDGDTILDGVDNCPLVSNRTQLNTDGDSNGDACDSDDDGDTIVDAADNCPLVSNRSQSNTDGDSYGTNRFGAAGGDACDVDDDNDGVRDSSDNCPDIDNANQADSDRDGQGDLCDSDNFRGRYY
ncbi:MAG TPA: hypothetical protein DDW49_01580 [Deltaproteobacteria bacterium]|nr:hypothetical protein [Deltaproteobacteria bacterium]